MPFASKQETGIAQVVSSFKEPLFSSILSPNGHLSFILWAFSHTFAYSSMKSTGDIQLFSNTNSNYTEKKQGILSNSVDTSTPGLHFLCFSRSCSRIAYSKYKRKSSSLCHREQLRTEHYWCQLLSLLIVQDAQGRPHSINTTKSPAQPATTATLCSLS